MIHPYLAGFHGVGETQQTLFLHSSWGQSIADGPDSIHSVVFLPTFVSLVFHDKATPSIKTFTSKAKLKKIPPFAMQLQHLPHYLVFDMLVFRARKLGINIGMTVAWMELLGWLVWLA